MDKVSVEIPLTHYRLLRNGFSKLVDPLRFDKVLAKTLKDMITRLFRNKYEPVRRKYYTTKVQFL